MTKVYLGKIVGTHGIKGELKLLSDFEKKDLVFKNNFVVEIMRKKYHIISHRVHKQYDLISLDDYDNINDVLFLVGNDVYMEKEDLNLKENEYLLGDLVGLEVIENEEILGVVTEILLSKLYPLMRIKNNDINILVPITDDYIESVSLEKKKLYTKNAKNLLI